MLVASRCGPFVPSVCALRIVAYAAGAWRWRCERRAVGVWRVWALAAAVDPLGHLVDGLGLPPGALRAEGVSAASEDSISMRDLRNNFDEKNYRQ